MFGDGVRLPGRRSPVDVSSPIEVRSNDLRVANDPARDGMVLLGDAFQTPCPSAGTGIDRLLSDVAALGRHVPDWLANPGVERGKVATFYADPAKIAADADALRVAERRRSVSIETGLAWRFHRARVRLRRRLRSADAAVLRLTLLRRTDRIFVWTWCKLIEGTTMGSMARRQAAPVSGSEHTVVSYIGQSKREP